jgi:hypothetical protein
MFARIKAAMEIAEELNQNWTRELLFRVVRGSFLAWDETIYELHEHKRSRKK